MVKIRTREKVDFESEMKRTVESTIVYMSDMRWMWTRLISIKTDELKQEADSRDGVMQNEMGKRKMAMVEKWWQQMRNEWYKGAEHR